MFGGGVDMHEAQIYIKKQQQKTEKIILKRGGGVDSPLGWGYLPLPLGL